MRSKNFTSVKNSVKSNAAKRSGKVLISSQRLRFAKLIWTIPTVRFALANKIDAATQRAVIARRADLRCQTRLGIGVASDSFW
jgi:hypothetical protein